MTPEETKRYLIEYSNASGELLLPQFGGCWHDFKRRDVAKDEAPWWSCRCGFEDYVTLGNHNPNLSTPDGFFALWNAMQAREDWEDFAYELFYCYSDESCGEAYKRSINPITFPATVAAYLKGLER